MFAALAALTCEEMDEVAELLWTSVLERTEGRTRASQVTPPFTVWINLVEAVQLISVVPGDVAEACFVQADVFHLAHPKSGVSICRSMMPADIPSWLVSGFSTPIRHLEDEVAVGNNGDSLSRIKQRYGD